MKLDRTDIGILRALQADARLSFRELARRVGVSVPTVSARVANLRDLGILKGFRAVVDPERLGQTRVIVVVRCNPGRTDAVGGELAQFPEVRWTVRTRNRGIIAEAVLPNLGSLPRFLARLRVVPGVISYAHHVAAGELKEEPRAVIGPSVSAMIECVECGQPIEGTPIRIRLDGRYHYVCCPSCERLFVERYEKIRTAAGKPRGGAAHGANQRPATDAAYRTRKIS